MKGGVFAVVIWGDSVRASDEIRRIRKGGE